MSRPDDISPILHAAIDAVRVDALHELQMLDTPAEAEFDDLVWLASRLCEVPIAVVNLVDTHRQWAKAACGVERGETSRAISFCSHAIEQDGVMEVVDAREDPRFADNPMVTGELQLRFYAGAPLIGRSGHRYGTLCVADTEPGRLDDVQREGLVRLARRTSAAMEARRRRIAAETREQTLAHLLDAMPNGVVTCDAHGLLTECNRTAREWHGVDPRAVPPEEWIEHFDLYEPDGVTPLRTEQLPLLRAFGGEVVRDQELVIQPAGRPARHVLANGEQVRAADGRVLGAVCVMHDVTEVRAAQEHARLEAARFGEAFGAAAQGMAIVGLDGRFLEVNDAFCAMLGYTNDELLERDFQRITHPEDQRESRDLATELLLGKRRSFQLDKRYVHSEGHAVWVHLSVSVVRDSTGRPLHKVVLVQDLTERKRAEARLRDSEQRLRSVLEHSYDAFVSVDERGAIVEWNRAAEATFGWRRSEVLGKPMAEVMVPPRLREAHRTGMARFMRSGQGTILDQRLQLPALHRNGSEFPVEMTISVVDLGTTRVFHAFLHDITRRVEGEARLRASERQLRTVADNVPALIAHVDAEQRYRFVNERYAGFFGRSCDEMLGARMRDVLHPEHYRSIEPKLEAVLRGETLEFDMDVPRDDEVRHMRATYRPAWAEGADPARDRPTGFHLMVHDVTAQVRLARVLEERALTDSLTGLPNRAAWDAELERGLARAARGAPPIAVMFLDLDGFKRINDTCGHGVGDAVLCEFASRLRGCLRTNDFIARLSGDEFVVLLDGVCDANAPALIEHKLRQAMALPMQIGSHRLRVTPSIGIAVHDGGSDAERLMREADAAMYRAKRAKADVRS
ncbi:PAS domain S-box protein [Cognatilysobacter bugurensis]|uniref:Sensor domain-containing diguanylate cyclase n=1 Tax=Cognatilysobacter bugurensis TaxID=543356 RepID=A0A918W9E5_9GAMM|nr:PAS domain S-box protein [Lysobacter bugurensis]GHA80830.1 sensor domain-containing diguanylate cyclase [Lysobacter bugurensis]